MKIIEILKYILIGIIQGVGEILPISSSGHVMIASRLFKIEEAGLFLAMLLNMASLFALIVYFYKEILELLTSFYNYIFIKESRLEHKENFFYVLKLIVVVLPIGVIGLFVKDYLNDLNSLLFVGIGILVTSLFLFVTFKLRNIQKNVDEITFKDALFIGLAQTLSLLPGISRSGSTIASGRALGKTFKNILVFSFLAYIIISIPISALTVYGAIKAKEQINYLNSSIAFVVTFISTYFTAKFVFKRFKVDHLIYFSIYLLVVGILAIFLHFI